ncbi:MAG: hypothetical protein IKY33_02890 [Clostridia bacterium]|nr:hypothetical protein [Clostridia bacterium]
MSDTKRWIQQNHSVLEMGLSKAQGSRLKALLEQGLEIENALLQEAEDIKTSQSGMGEALTPDKKLAHQLSETLSENALALSRHLSNQKLGQPEKIVLQKLVASQDQMVYRLREFL